MKTYRGVLVCSDFRLTSQNPGQGHSATEAVPAHERYSRTVPQLRNPSVERRIERNLNLSAEQATQLFYDVQKFLWMSAQSTGPCIPSPLIDDTWHEFMLFTREYEQFCQAYCGGFIHHEPHSGDAVEPVDVAILSPTIDLLFVTFGGKPNSNWDYVPRLTAIAA